VYQESVRRASDGWGRYQLDCSWARTTYYIHVYIPPGVTETNIAAFREYSGCRLPGTHSSAYTYFRLVFMYSTHSSGDWFLLFRHAVVSHVLPRFLINERMSKLGIVA
jgi:hypothetical protein